MEVDDVESVRHSQHLLDHDEVRRELIDAVGIEPQGLRNDRHELGSRAGISACEERDLVSLMNEFFGQVGHDPLGAAIVFRWNGLIEGATCAIFTRGLLFSHVAAHNAAFVPRSHEDE